MKTTLRPTITIALFAGLVALAACGGDDGTEPPTPPTDTQLYTSGWNALRAGDTAKAETEFRRLVERGRMIPHAWDGLGWTFTVAAEDDSALANFRRAVAAGVDTTNAADQARGGQCFAANAAQQYRESVDAGALVPAGWVFEHTSEVDHDDVLLAMASSHYFLSEFAEALALVIEVDPAFSADVGTVAGREALARRIEYLQQL